MKALLEMIRYVATHPNEAVALATLVATEGSTYRKPGARMLVTGTGHTIGALSGGCLETELAREAEPIIAGGSTRLRAIDARKYYGCDGRLQVFLEQLPAAGERGNLLTRIGEALASRRNARVLTCFDGENPGSELLADDALVPESPGIFLHDVPLPIRLLLFGSGPEIAPLRMLGETLGWVVHTYAYPSELPENFESDAQTAAVVMTHQFGRDLATLHRLLPHRLPYLGLLGPRKRRDELIGHLAESDAMDLEGIRALHAPAGLDLGSEAPEEIALAIVSEAAAVLAGRRAGFLREVKPPAAALGCEAAA